MVAASLGLISLERCQFPAFGLVGDYDPSSVVQFPCRDAFRVNPLVDGAVAYLKLLGQLSNEPFVFAKFD